MRRAKSASVAGSTSNIAQPAGIWSRGTARVGTPASSFCAMTRAAGQHQLLARLLHQVARHVDPLRFDQRVAGLESHGAEERARHRAADQDLVHLRQQRLDEVDLAGDLGAAEHGDERPPRLVERLAQVLELLLHEEAHHRRLEHAGHALGAGVRPVRRPEGIVHVDVAQRGRTAPPAAGRSLPRPGKNRVFSMTATPPRGSRFVAVIGCVGEGIRDQFHRRPQQLLQLAHHRRERERRIRALLGPAEVRHEHHARALVAQELDRRQRGPDPRVVGDHPVLHRAVEIDSHKSSLAIESSLVLK